jgi:hypothetical protein
MDSKTYDVNLTDKSISQLSQPVRQRVASFHCVVEAFFQLGPVPHRQGLELEILSPLFCFTDNIGAEVAELECE